MVEHKINFCIHKELEEASKPPTNSVSMHISDICLTSCSSMCVGREGRGCCVCQPAHPRSQTCIWWPVEGRCLGALCWRWSQRDRPQTSATYPEGRSKMDSLTLQTFYWMWKRADCSISIDTGRELTTEERNKLLSYSFWCVYVWIMHGASLIFLCLFDSFYKAWPINLP